METLQSKGEFGFLQELLPELYRQNSHIRVPVGDDAAAVDFEGCSLYSTDLLIEDVHFCFDWTTYQQLGYKSLAVNMSDLAAMGGQCHWVLVGMGCPGDTTIDALKEFYVGMQELADEAGVVILGGDMAQCQNWVISVTAIGSVIKPVTVSQAKVGESIYLTGTPGLAALGLKIMQKQGLKQATLNGYEEAVLAQLCPNVCWKTAPSLASTKILGAMTDVSDGLSRDLNKICKASGVGAQILQSQIPCHELFIWSEEEFSWSTLDFQLHGGEDYGLLFTSNDTCDFPKIGTIQSADSGVRLVKNSGEEIDLEPGGFDHFQ